MLDQTKVKSGFDMEVLLGKGFFGEILLAYRDAKIFPSTLEIADGIELTLKGLELVFASNFQIGMKFDLTLKMNGTEYAAGPTDLFFTFELIPIKTSTGNVSDVKIKVSYHSANNAQFNSFMQLFGGDLPVEINGETYSLSQLERRIKRELRDRLQFEYTTNLVTNKVQDVQVKMLSNPKAIGLYLNFIMRKGPAQGNTYPARGDISKAQNPLTELNNIGIFVPGTVYPMLTTEIKTTMARKKSNGKYYYPIFDQRFLSQRVIGNLKSFVLTTAEQIAAIPLFGIDDPEQLLVSIKTRIHYRSIDADADAWMTLSPEIVTGKLKWNNTRLHTDIDVDWDDQLRLALIGGIFISIFTGFAALPFLTAILYAAQSVMEDVAEDYLEDYARGFIQDEADNLMGSIPEAITVGKRRRDPFFETHYQVVTDFVEAKTNKEGMAFVANTKHKDISMLLGDISIKKAVRNKRHKLVGLIYKVPKVDQLENADQYNCSDPNKLDEFFISLEEVKLRLKAKRIRKNLSLKATHVKKSGNSIKYIKFDSGVYLTPHEAGTLNQLGALRVQKYKRIYQKQLKRFYFRGKADRTTRNNLASLPVFRP